MIATRIVIVTAVIGLLLGFFGQRSRICFIGGWRDFFLIRDTYLLKGFFAFLITAAILFFAFNKADYYLKSYPWFLNSASSSIGNTEDAELYQILEQCDLTPRGGIFVKGDASAPGLHFGDYTLAYDTIVIFAAAFFLGLFSTLANGCPIRQHVMAASGNGSALLYLAGFYVAILAYESFVLDFINNLIK